MGGGEPAGVGQFGEDRLGGDGADARDGPQQLAVGLEPLIGGDEGVGLGLEVVGLLARRATVRVRDFRSASVTSLGYRVRSVFMTYFTATTP